MPASSVSAAAKNLDAMLAEIAKPGLAERLHRDEVSDLRRELEQELAGGARLGKRVADLEGELAAADSILRRFTGKGIADLAAMSDADLATAAREHEGAVLELANVDLALAGRDALAGIKGRAAKIEAACRRAAEADQRAGTVARLERDLTEARNAVLREGLEVERLKAELANARKGAETHREERDLAREQRDAADARAEAPRVEDAKLLKERGEARAQRDVAETVLITRGYLRALLMAPTETTAGGPGVVEQSLRAQVTALEAKVDSLRTENTNLSNERGTVMTQLEGERRDHHATQTRLCEAKAWIAQVDNVLNVTVLDHVKGDRIDKILAALNYCMERDREVTLLKKERDLAREQRDAADARAADLRAGQESLRAQTVRIRRALCESEEMFSRAMDTEDIAKAVVAERDEANRHRFLAEQSLEGAGWTRVVGSAGWKPPLGKAPDFDRLDRLVAAASALYFAAHWTADRPVDEGALWTNLRDAAGITPGQTAAILGPRRENAPRVLDFAGGADPKTFSGPVTLDELEEAIAATKRGTEAQAFREGLTVARDTVCRGCAEGAPLVLSGTHHRGGSASCCTSQCRAIEVRKILGEEIGRVGVTRSSKNMNP